MTDLQEYFRGKKYDRIQTLRKIDLFNKLGESSFNKIKII